MSLRVLLAVGGIAYLIWFVALDNKIGGDPKSACDAIREQRDEYWFRGMLGPQRNADAATQQAQLAAKHQASLEAARLVLANSRCFDTEEIASANSRIADETRR